jgi:sterol desaturase/sphingolipid hydroxylase (fatty acid hydroxylase superfamily)
VGNYASSFRLWDWLFGTSKAFNAWKAKKAAGVNGDDAIQQLKSKIE